MKYRIGIFTAIIIVSVMFTACSGQPALPTLTPVSIPASTFTSVPTDTRIPTELPPTPTPTPTATMTPVPNGPCDNPLIPLVTGNEWAYLVSGGREPYPYKLKVGERADVGNININVEFFDPKHNRDIKELVICQEGAIDNFPLHVMSMLLGDYLDGALNTYKQSGQYAPAYPVFAQNNWIYAWQFRYLVEEVVAIKDPAGASSIMLGYSSPIDVSFKTDGKYESTIVPGGSFPQALVVANDYTMGVTVVVKGITTSGILVIHTTQWYVPYVGLVRALVDSASISIVAGQESSIPIVSVLELTEFKPGK